MRELTIKDFPIGEENRIYRDQLVSLSGKSDRKIRQEIQKLREKGCPIISSTEKGGYWLPKTYEELESWVSMIESYAKSLYLTTKKAKRIISNKDQQFINYDVFN